MTSNNLPLTAKSGPGATRWLWLIAAVAVLATGWTQLLLLAGLVGAGMTLLSETDAWLPLPHLGARDCGDIVASVLLPLYYHLKLTSIYHYLQLRFGAHGGEGGRAPFGHERLCRAVAVRDQQRYRCINRRPRFGEPSGEIGGG